MALLGAANLCAQGRGGRGGPPPTGKAGAPLDLTGYWVAQINGDWRFRMVTPPKGDFAGIQLNPAGRALANAWDPAKDEAAGEQCKAYGAAGLMRIPTRLHFTWQDDQTLTMEADAGTQTRMFYFTVPQSQGGGWQGVSKASWEYLPGSSIDTMGTDRGSLNRSVGSMKVVTTNLKSGYLRKNGIPYSDKAVLTEYFDRVQEPDGDSYMILTTTVEDPTYLSQPVMISTHFKKQADAAGWNPTPCSAR